MTTDEERWLQSVGRASRRNAVLSLLSFVLIACALGYGAWKVNQLQGAISTKQQQLVALRSQETSLQQSIGRLVERVNELQPSPLKDLVVPKLSATQLLDMKGPKGEQLYDFTLWVDVPEARRGEIGRVEYRFNHPTILQKVRTSSEPSNGFAVSYRGYTCLPVVEIIVILAAGDSHPYFLDMCNAFREAIKHG